MGTMRSTRSAAAAAAAEPPPHGRRPPHGRQHVCSSTGTAPAPARPRDLLGVARDAPPVRAPNPSNLRGGAARLIGDGLGALSIANEYRTSHDQVGEEPQTEEEQAAGSTDDERVRGVAPARTRIGGDHHSWCGRGIWLRPEEASCRELGVQGGKLHAPRSKPRGPAERTWQQLWLGTPGRHDDLRHETGPCLPSFYSSGCKAYFSQNQRRLP